MLAKLSNTDLYVTLTLSLSFAETVSLAEALVIRKPLRTFDSVTKASKSHDKMHYCAGSGPRFVPYRAFAGPQQQIVEHEIKLPRTDKMFLSDCPNQAFLIALRNRVAKVLVAAANKQESLADMLSEQDIVVKRRRLKVRNGKVGKRVIDTTDVVAASYENLPEAVEARHQAVLDNKPTTLPLDLKPTAEDLKFPLTRSRQRTLPMRRQFFAEIKSVANREHDTNVIMHIVKSRPTTDEGRFKLLYDTNMRLFEFSEDRSEVSVVDKLSPTGRQVSKPQIQHLPTASLSKLQLLAQKFAK